MLVLGALHKEMVMLGCLGNWLQDSGWNIALSNTGVTPSGNDSLLSGQDVAIKQVCSTSNCINFITLMTNAFEHKLHKK